MFFSFKKILVNLALNYGSKKELINTFKKIKIKKMTENIVKNNLFCFSKFGMNHFWYEKNSLVGHKLYEYNDIAAYKSKSNKEGYIFYRGIMRNKIPHIPIVINIDKNKYSNGSYLLRGLSNKNYKFYKLDINSMLIIL